MFDERRKHRELCEGAARTIGFIDRLAGGNEYPLLTEREQEEFGLDADADMWDALDVATLSLEGLWTGPLFWGEGDPLTLKTVVIVLTTGGPHTEARIHFNGWCDVVTYGWFGSNKQTLRINVENLAYRLWDAADQFDGATR